MPKRVLITDDTAFMRMSLRDILQKNGYEVVGEAADGEQAVQQYFALKPELVTMDVTMPNMDGITAVKKIVGKDSNARIIIVSAMGQKAMVMDAIKAGAKDFIVKPFKPERVMEAITRLFGG